MKLGLQARFIYSFLMVIFIPVAITGILLALALNRLNHDPKFQKYTKTDSLFQDVTSRIEKDFFFIDDYSAFQEELSPFIDKYGYRIQIIDTKGHLRFDSQDREASFQKRPVDLKSIYGMDNALGVNAAGYGKYTSPIIFENTLAGSTIITYTEKRLSQNLIGEIIVYVAASFIIGFFTLVGLISLFSWRLSRDILFPLKELSQATASIARGDMNFQVTYQGRNELGRFCEAFNLMKDKLAESLDKQAAEERARRDLIASISHDLRTPMASIKGYVEGLQDGIIHDKAKFARYLSVIQNKTAELDRLIDDLFRFSQLETGSLDIQLTRYDAKKMLEDIIAPIEYDFLDKQKNLVVNRPFPPVCIYADKSRIAQVLTNIIQNADRYSDENGCIEVRAAVLHGKLEITVEDNGIGIPHSDLPHIFERFYRGEKSRSRQYGGIGLGLAICKYIIEKHRGEIWVESTQGVGSIFHFTLPAVDKENV